VAGNSWGAEGNETQKGVVVSYGGRRHHQGRLKKTNRGKQKITGVAKNLKSFEQGGKSWVKKQKKKRNLKIGKKKGKNQRGSFTKGKKGCKLSRTTYEGKKGEQRKKKGGWDGGEQLGEKRQRSRWDKIMLMELENKSTSGGKGVQKKHSDAEVGQAKLLPG